MILARVYHMNLDCFENVHIRWKTKTGMSDNDGKITWAIIDNLKFNFDLIFKFCEYQDLTIQPSSTMSTDLIKLEQHLASRSYIEG